MSSVRRRSSHSVASTISSQSFSARFRGAPRAPSIRGRLSICVLCLLHRWLATILSSRQHWVRAKHTLMYHRCAHCPPTVKASSLLLVHYISLILCKLNATMNEASLDSFRPLEPSKESFEAIPPPSQTCELHIKRGHEGKKYIYDLGVCKV